MELIEELDKGTLFCSSTKSNLRVACFMPFGLSMFLMPDEKIE